MTKLKDQIHEMQRSLTENALTERAFVAGLGEALSQVDYHLVDEVRRLREEHTARRGAILQELQSLSNNLCALPAPRDVQPSIDHHPEPSEFVPRSTFSHQHAPGDWRKAMNAIEEDLESVWRPAGQGY